MCIRDRSEKGITPKDAESFIHAIGGDLTGEEALELVKQASRGSKLETGQQSRTYDREYDVCTIGSRK